MQYFICSRKNSNEKTIIRINDNPQCVEYFDYDGSFKKCDLLKLNLSDEMREISASQLVEAIKAVDKKMITDVIIFDLYVGEKIEADEKSIACKVVFSSNETLTDEVVNAKVNKILKTLEKNNFAKLRA